MNKKVYCYGPGFHTYVKAVLKNPPKGYEFVVNEEKSKESILNFLKKYKFFVFIYKDIIKKVFNVFSLLNKVYYKESPEGVDLIYAVDQLIYEKKPWVLEMLDLPVALGGHDYQLFVKNLKKIEETLASDYCKKIIVLTEDCKSYFEKYFSDKVNKKIDIVSPAIPEKNFKREYKNKKTRILFMGSINNPDDFLIKGGLEVLETFKYLNKKSRNFELVVRCKIPEKIKNRYDLTGITLIENPVENIDKLYEEADILFMPGHLYFLMTYLEALSFGLPIVAQNTFGVSDFVINEKNGFLIKRSEKIPYDRKDYPSSTLRTKIFLDEDKDIDRRVIKELGNSMLLLINNKKLREKMSEESFKLSKNKFSLNKRIRILKGIFDKALS